MKLLQIIANTRILLWISLFEILANSVLHVLESHTAKWYLLAWMIWTIFILSLRVWFNGDMKARKM